MKDKKTDLYKEHSCEFVNETECDEEMDEEGIDIDDAEKEYFDEEKDAFEE